jgi:hypothetical protein
LFEALGLRGGAPSDRVTVSDAVIPSPDRFGMRDLA